MNCPNCDSNTQYVEGYHCFACGYIDALSTAEGVLPGASAPQLETLPVTGQSEPGTLGSGKFTADMSSLFIPAILSGRMTLNRVAEEITKKSSNEL